MGLIKFPYDMLGLTQLLLAKARNNELHFHLCETNFLLTLQITIFLYFYSCLDASAGYLHHHPEMAVRILVSCVCLHNIATIKGFPLPPPENEEDQDGIPNRPPRREATVENLPPGRARLEHIRRRKAFINDYFGN